MNVNQFLIIIILIIYNIFKCAKASKNIVLILTDDLDLTLDGMTPLKNTLNLIGQNGATFENAFVASPICCPNRASILTGKYLHNHFVSNNSIEGNCNSFFWQNQLEKQTFANILKMRLNYKTFYAGKYMNKYGNRKVGGISHIPSGWDWWYGLVGNSKYYNYSLSINGTERKYATKPEHYLTDVISKFATNFISQQPRDERFLMVLAPPAPHAPFTAAPRHLDKYKNITAKKTANFNKLSHKENRHWLLRMEPIPLPDKVLLKLDEVYRKRWQTLLAVDELVLNVYQSLKSRNILNDTYIIFTSDNGYHIGQFGLTIDKRQPYESDIRVPLMIFGPDIQPNKIASPVSSVDIFATILNIAGLDVQSDGISLLRKLPDDRTLLIEYKGEKSNGNKVPNCPLDDDPNLSLCSDTYACKCQDSVNNTYSCIRRFSNRFDNIFCEFEDQQNFLEFYNLKIDPDQMENTVQKMGKKRRYKYRKRLGYLKGCINNSCFL